jgi:hypothetical protein
MSKFSFEYLRDIKAIFEEVFIYLFIITLIAGSEERSAGPGFTIQRMGQYE